MPILSIEIPWDPNITRIGGFLLTWHGLFTAVGILVGVQVSLRLAKVVGYDYDDAYSLALVGVPSGSSALGCCGFGRGGNGIPARSSSSPRAGSRSGARSSAASGGR